MATLGYILLPFGFTPSWHRQAVIIGRPIATSVHIIAPGFFVLQPCWSSPAGLEHHLARAVALLKVGVSLAAAHNRGGQLWVGALVATAAVLERTRHALQRTTSCMQPLAAGPTHLALSRGKALLMRGGCRAVGLQQRRHLCQLAAVGLDDDEAEAGAQPQQASQLAAADRAGRRRQETQGRGGGMGYELDSGGWEATQQGQQAHNFCGYWRSIRSAGQTLRLQRRTTAS
jgi:hypothetical protein